MNEIKRNEKGYSLLPDGTVNWETVKQADADKFYAEEYGTRRNPHKKHGSNYTPPKKRHRR